jgi:hypothetical protein
MVFPLAGIIGGMIGTRGLHALSLSGGSFLKSPIIQGGGFGIGYTSGAYGGYGISNTIDPLGIHKPKYSHTKSNLGLPYGSYGRRRYGRSYGTRYSGNTRYRRRSYYRRRRPYYSRRYY